VGGHRPPLWYFPITGVPAPLKHGQDARATGLGRLFAYCLLISLFMNKPFTHNLVPKLLLGDAPGRQALPGKSIDNAGISEI